MSRLRYERIVVLSGAGLSAESGLGTFRDTGGLWAQYDLDEVATPAGFARNPQKVLDFYNMRRRNLLAVEPNAAHRALARLAANYPGEVLIVTQNIDDMLERAGLSEPIHMHGELLKALCNDCYFCTDWREDIATTTPCPDCGVAGGMRPDVVWFGEIPYQMDKIALALKTCDLFVSIGTSGSVYPAAAFVEAANRCGAHTIELNLEASDGARLFAEAQYGPATQVVPEFVTGLLADAQT